MRALSSFCLILYLALCAAGFAQSEPEAPETPPPAAEAGAQGQSGDAAGAANWIEQILAREAEPLGERPLASDDGGFKTRVAAEVVSPPEVVDGDYYVQLNVGSVSPMECWIYPEGHDVAASHRAMSESIFEVLARVQGEIERKAIQRIDAGVFGAHPYLALDWVYRVKTPEGPLVGQVKLLAAYGDGASVHCVHTEAGYSQTFERVFRGLFERLELDSPAAEPYYQEAWVLRLKGLTLGVARMTMTLDEGGDTRIDERLSVLVPVDQAALATRDTYNIQFSSPDGRLINKTEIGAVNGEITMRLDLEPAADGAWQVSGTRESKEYEASLEPRELSSELGLMLQLREFLPGAEAGDQATSWHWFADADPAAFTEVRVDVKEKTAGGIAADLDMGVIKTAAILDANGSVKSGTFTLEGVEAEVERLFVAGAVPGPPAGVNRGRAETSER